MSGGKTPVGAEIEPTATKLLVQEMNITQKEMLAKRQEEAKDHDSKRPIHRRGGRENLSKLLALKVV